MNNKNQKHTWLWILLCLPTVFIVYFAVTLSGGSIDPANVSAVNVVTPDGTAMEFDGEDISFYVNMYLEADPLSSPIRDVNAELPMNVTLKQKTGDLTFAVYAESNTNGCFFRKTDGKYFSVPASFAKTLLQRKECAFVYERAGYTLPGLSFVTGDSSTSVLPQSFKWQYKDIAGAATEDTFSKKATEAQHFSFYSDKGFTLRFAKEPSQHTVTFYREDGTVIDAVDPSALIFPTDTNLKVVVDAKWQQDADSMGGEAKYSFTLLYDVLPEIIRSTETVKPGDVLCIGFRHLSQNEKIRLESQLKTAPLRVTYTDDGAYALLPISGNNSAGQYSLKFTVGTVEKLIDVNVIDSTPNIVLDTMDTEKFYLFQTPDFIQRHDSLMEGWASTTGEAAFLAGDSFVSPISGDAAHSYGDELLINGQPDKYFLEGNDYKAEDGALIKATQRGTVAFVGEDDVLGNMVIIDHGYGIKSHYYGVATVSKAVGDTVQKGETIGSAGVNGMVYTSGNDKLPTLHFYVSLDGVYVNPNELIKNGLYILD